MFATVAISIPIIRALGPTAYGVLAYGLSLIAVVEVLSGLGMRSVVVQQLVLAPDARRAILGTAVALRFIVAALAVALVTALWLRDADSQILLVLLVLVAGLPIMALTQLDFLFQARLEARPAAVGRTIALAAAAVVRIALLVAGAPVEAFAAATGAEFALLGVSTAVVYSRRYGSLHGLRVSRMWARRLTSLSWPLFASALAAVVYLRVDQVMLLNLAGPEEVGVYAAAARLTDMWYFIPIALATSLLPLLVERREEKGEAGYHRALLKGYAVAGWLAIAVALVMSLVATPVVSLLFGEGFADSAAILRVHTWSAPFLFLGAILTRALVAEDMRGFELTRQLIGAGLNVLLNFLLIPPLGGMGAALATLASYAVAGYLVLFAYPPARVHARLISRALLRPDRAINGR